MPAGRRASRIGTWLAVALGLATFPAAAPGATFCVQAPGCSGTGVPDLGDAMAAANAAAGPDRIEVGAVTTPAPTVAATGPVELVGAGRGQTVIAAPASLGVTTTLFLTSDASGSSVSDLTIRFGGTGKRGLALETDVALRRVRLEGTGDLQRSTGLAAFDGTSTLDDSAIALPAGGADNTGVTVGSGASLAAADVSVAATDGLVASGTLGLRRADVRTGGLGVAARAGSEVGVYSSLLHTGGTGLSATVGGGDGAEAALLARNLTMVGAGAADHPGVEAAAAGDPSATASLYDSVVLGYAVGFRCLDAEGGPTGTGQIEEDYNRLDTTARAVACAQGAPAGPHTLADGAPGLADPAGGDYRLRWDSPLVDASTPGAPTAAESATDLGGLPRDVDGDGAAGPRVDIGAFEYQRRPPTVASIAARGGGRNGEAAFSGAAADPDGDPVTLTWRFDDGASAAGAAVTHRFAAGGRHIATLVASDATGLTATRDVAIDVPRAPSRQPARISRLSLSPATFGTVRRHGRRRARPTTIAWRLDAAARVSFTVDRFASGRRAGRGPCRARSRALRHAPRCVRWMIVPGTMRVAGRAGANRLRFRGRVGARVLRAGRYRLRAVAVSAGGISDPSAAAFRVVR